MIIVMFRGAKSLADDAVESTGSKNTEPLTVFTNARLAFNRPDVVFGAANTKIFEAGAGRNTSCATDTLTTTVDLWNTLYENSKSNNEYTATFGGADRDVLALIDQTQAQNSKEELAYYELNVEYPFIVDKMEISQKDDMSKVQGWVSMDELTAGPAYKVVIKVHRAKIRKLLI